MALQAGRVGVRADQVDVYGRVNDTSFFNKIIDKLITWVDLPVWKGGTEQLLPENDDEPETSPIMCDIDYPDEERKNQYFTYRESPTTSDGIAKIESIRGKTLVWNQLLQNGNFVNTTGWSAYQGTLSVSNNVVTFTSNNENGGNLYCNTSYAPVGIEGHKYLFSGSFKNGGQLSRMRFRLGSTSSGSTLAYYESTTSNWENHKAILHSGSGVCQIELLTFGNEESVQGKDFYIIDLTKMFGAGKEPATVDQFESLFPLPYYAYDTGSLLNFTADKIKTVGFNQWDEEWELGYYDVTGQPVASSENIRCKNYIPVLANTTYYALTNRIYIYICEYDVNKNFIGTRYGYVDTQFTTLSNTKYIKFNMASGYGTTYNNNICINISDATKNGTYEPYTTNTLELPISDFFPTGMKSAGEVYDELLPRRATSNIGSIDLGTLTWTHRGEIHQGLFSTQLQFGSYKYYEDCQCLCSKYEYKGTVDAVSKVVDLGDKTCSVYYTQGYESNYIYIYDSTYSDAPTFKSAMNGVMFNYELAEPIVLPTIDFGD